MSQRVKDVLEGPDAELAAEIIDAVKCHDVHAQLQSYIVYSIQVGPLLVKRRYSEFESLRGTLVKLFPTSLIPPIPEKQSLSSNIATNSMRITSGKIQGSGAGAHSVNSGPIDSSPSSNDIHKQLGNVLNGYENNKAIKLVGYRKRMLSVFLNRCLKMEKVRKSKHFFYFLDAQTNFSEYLNSKDCSLFVKTSIYQLSPFDPLDQIENQLYLTLPVPSSSDAHLFKEAVEENDQFTIFIHYEAKFLKYEHVLNNIAKVNKHLLKHFSDLSVDMLDLGAGFNQLSMIQDSNMIELVGKGFEHRNLFLTELCESINLEFLDKLLEMKQFSTTAKQLIGYNRKKIIQLKIVEKELFQTRARAKRFENEEKRIREIDIQARHAVGNNNTDDLSDSPITDDELQSALYSKSKKSLYQNIPGVNKINNMILKYVSDPNPDETRRNKHYDLRLKLFQLERQYTILNDELTTINESILKELNMFHDWFKNSLNEIMAEYNFSLKSFFDKCKSSWDAIN